MTTIRVLDLRPSDGVLDWIRRQLGWLPPELEPIDEWQPAARSAEPRSLAKQFLGGGEAYEADRIDIVLAETAGEHNPEEVLNRVTAVGDAVRRFRDPGQFGAVILNDSIPEPSLEPFDFVASVPTARPEVLALQLLALREIDRFGTSLSSDNETCREYGVAVKLAIPSDAADPDDIGMDLAERRFTVAGDPVVSHTIQRCAVLGPEQYLVPIKNAVEAAPVVDTVETDGVAAVLGSYRGDVPTLAPDRDTVPSDMVKQ
jgi:hypothetical protein